MPNSSGKSKDRYAPTITSASGPVISRRRFVTLSGAAASLVLIGPHRPASAAIYFEDGFDRIEDTFTNWDRVHVRNNSATTDPIVKRSGTHGLKMSVQDIDSNTFGWSGVRSHLVKENLFREGLERYIGWSTYVPADHPTVTQWFDMGQFGYTGDTMPPTIFELRGDGHFGLIYHATSQAILKWRSAVPLKGAWHDFVARFYFHRSQGWLEFWVDGVPQTMTNGAKRIYYPTLNPRESATSLSHLHICNYRARYQMQWSTIYHDSVKVGDSYAAVDPAGDVAAPPPSGTLYFEDFFDRDADTFPNWDKVLANNNSATTDATIKRSGTHSLKMSVEDIDSNTYGYTGVRSHIQKNNLLAHGTERYIGFSLYIPQDHPTVTEWQNLFQLAYTGFTMPPTIFTHLSDGRIAMESHSEGWSSKWRSPTSVRGAWHDIVIRAYFHRDPAQGWVELWLDGVPQTMNNGQKRIYYSTFHPNESASTAHLHVNNYRERGQFQWSTVYFDAVRVGSTYAIVDPSR